MIFFGKFSFFQFHFSFTPYITLIPTSLSFFMKMFKPMFCVALVTTVLSTSVQANPSIVNQHAIQTAQTVSQAKQLGDEQFVSLKGHIVKAKGKEKYEFRDHTGTITVEIDDELWQGRPLSTQQSIIIQGEVDVSYLPFKTVEIDVDRVIF